MKMKLCTIGNEAGRETVIFPNYKNPLKIVRRIGGGNDPTFYIGKPDNGVEIDREQAGELATLLRRFSRTGSFQLKRHT